MSHAQINECSVKVNSLENEADRVCDDAISGLFEKRPIRSPSLEWKEIYETFERRTDR